jgi:hypothetical protein
MKSDILDGFILGFSKTFDLDHDTQTSIRNAFRLNDSEIKLIYDKIYPSRNLSWFFFSFEWGVRFCSQQNNNHVSYFVFEFALLFLHHLQFHW